jgi:predicted aspartyl protease
MMQRALGCTAMLVALLALQACSSAAAPPAPTSTTATRPADTPTPAGPSTSVRIQIVNNKLLVPVTLNESQPATFLLDTGASTTVVTADLARRLGMTAGAVRARARIASGQEVDVALVRLGSLRVGTARIDAMPVAVYEVASLGNSASLPVAIDGFLGMDFVGRFLMTVDPRAGTLTLGVPPR